MCACEYIYIYIQRERERERKKEREREREREHNLKYTHIFLYVYEKKLKKQNIPKFNEFIMKVDVERFGCNNLLQDFKFMKNVVKIAMDVWWNN